MESTLLKTEAWKELSSHHEEVKKKSLRDLFREDSERGSRYSVRDTGIYFDYSKHLVTDETISLLIKLAQERGLNERIEAMFGGERINSTENRAVLHTALRVPVEADSIPGADYISDQVQEVLDKMSVFSEEIRSGKRRGYTGKKFSRIINIGIGGSDLGPVMVYEALRNYASTDLSFRFVSNIDASDLAEALRDADPEETLFIVSSKTFTTLETLTNARSARDWFLKYSDNEEAIAKHFVAVSTNAAEVAGFGIDVNNMFTFWDWVGGRYSVDSAIGLSIMIATGSEAFRSMLDGMHQMDQHFRHTPPERNIPVLMGLLTVWYSNFFNARAHAVLPYDNYLKRFPAYLQQLIMESNGKSVTLGGERVDYHTSPVFWGEPGTNGQHSFYQLIHQGTMMIPCDFIGFLEPLNDIPTHHDYLIANMIAQGQALAFGKSYDEVAASGVDRALVPHKVFEGNRPSSTLFFDKLTPLNLGKLIALYEHSVFTQGVIWGINSFDQMGVELGKELAGSVIATIRDSDKPLEYDSSTNELLKLYQRRDG